MAFSRRLGPVVFALSFLGCSGGASPHVPIPIDEPSTGSDGDAGDAPRDGTSGDGEDDGAPDAAPPGGGDGSSASDAGQTPVDGPDASPADGASDSDGGATGEDAGAGDGADGMDAGTDASDAGSAETDAGTPEEPPIDLRLNHLQVAGTHNSYHQQPLIPFDASHRYTHKPLDQQLEGGVRTLELDLHRDLDGDMSVYHIVAIDQSTSCDRLVDCLGVVKGWSDAHPRHTPIFIWFEIKNDTGGTGINDAGEVDTEVAQVFSDDALITPGSLAAGYASPRARVEAAGWPTLDEVAGKVMFVLLNTDAITQGYTRGYQNLDGRRMFANTTSDQYALPWAVVTKLGSGDAGTIASALAAKMLVAANVCGAGQSDADCESDLSAAVSNGVHMLKDDFPFPIAGKSYYLRLPGGSPGCNPVTAPAGCLPSLLE